MYPTVQSIFQKKFDDSSLDLNSFNAKQKKVFNDIIRCRTYLCGCNRDICDSCGDIRTHYNSCKNPACPQCGAVDKELWIKKQELYVLDIKYFHIVFTIPDELNPLVLLAPDIVYDILFRSSAHVLKSTALDPKYLGAKIGFLSVLHTWGQNLSLHPHVHMIVSGGGVTNDGKWINSRKKFFVPVKVLSKRFSYFFLTELKSRFPVNRLKDKDQLQTIIDRCFSKEWVVYSKKPMKSPHHVIKYLGRYTHRIAISNGRIKDHSDNKVTFSYKDYRDRNKIKEMKLDENEFIRRFMMHVLPKGFTRIRYYGFLSNANKQERFKELRKITSTKEPEVTQYKITDIISKLIKKDVTICPHCGLRRHYQLE